MSTHILFIILGLAGGFLVNYLSDVLPQRKALVKPFCPTCEAPLSWKHYLFTVRTYPTCGHSVQWRKWVVLLIYMLIAAILWKSPPTVLGPWLSLIILGFFGVVVIIDIEHKLILHKASLFGAGLGLITGTWLRANYYALQGVTNGPEFLRVSSEAWVRGLGASLLGGIFGYGIMWVLYTLGEKWIGLMAKRRDLPADEVALGFGDVNLSGVLGLMLGWPVIILGLLIAVFIGGIISLLYLLISLVFRRYHLFTALPYGPNLIASAIILLFFSKWVTSILK